MDGAWRAAAGLCESPLVAGKGTALTGGSRTAVREGGGRAELGRERETGRLDWASRGRKRKEGGEREVGQREKEREFGPKEKRFYIF